MNAVWIVKMPWEERNTLKLHGVKDISETGSDVIWREKKYLLNRVSEGFDDSSTSEFIRFLGYSQRSCGEVQSQLYRALDCEYIDKSEFKTVYDLAGECRKQIKGFRKYLRNYKSKKNWEWIPKFLNIIYNT